MPGLGKSGTCRMRALSVSISLSDLESCDAMRRRHLLGLHVCDARLCRTAPDRGFHPIDRLVITLGHDLDASVGQVPHPAVHAFTRRHIVREPAEPDALDPPGHDVAPRDKHKRSSISRWARCSTCHRCWEVLNTPIDG